MGRHRAGLDDVGGRGRRFAVPSAPTRRWPVVLVAMLAVVAIGWFAWSAVGRSGHQAAAAANCPDGTLSIQVAVAPSVAPAVAAAAAAFAATNPVSTDHCLRVDVSSINEQDVLTGLTTTWNTDRLGPKPQAWLADSSLWTNAVAAAKPAELGDSAQSVATSPVVLAMPPDAARAMSSAGAPTWDAVPTLITKANGWATFGEPGWGQVTMAVPDPTTNTASALAVEAMLDPATPQGQQPITPDLLSSPAVRQNLANLALGQPNPVPATTAAALDALGKANGIEGAPFSAVPVTELDLYRRNVGSGGAKPANILDEVRLSGLTPFADFPYVPLAGDWVTSDQVVAAQRFRDFLLGSAQQHRFAKAGLRTPNAFDRPDSSPGMDWGSSAQAATPTDNAGYRALVAAWGTAGQQNR
jgi:Ca-activated chloride channel homolog